ncbi:MAG: replication-relaxation family protein [Deltaproteobacteria bacterium]|nr:replication-relaxation family protein [Deltaproteobacteria bacterium]
MEQKRGIRARREGWARDVTPTLNERDVQILYLIGTCGIVRTRDVTRFFFGARCTSRDRLRKLFCAGLLECFVPTLASDNYYALTALGRDRVLEEHDLDPRILRVVKKLPKKLDHGLAITEIRLSIALACRDDTHYALGSFETDADLAEARHASLLDVIPDAKVTIRERVSGIVHTFFVEVDLGTESLTWLVRHKLMVYASHAALGTALYGTKDPLVILAVPGLRRARNIARSLRDHRVLARVVLTLLPALTEGAILGATYALPEDLLTAPEAEAQAIFTRRLLP